MQNGHVRTFLLPSENETLRRGVHVDEMIHTRSGYLTSSSLYLLERKWVRFWMNVWLFFGWIPVWVTSKTVSIVRIYHIEANTERSLYRRRCYVEPGSRVPVMTSHCRLDRGTIKQAQCCIGNIVELLYPASEGYSRNVK